MRELGRGGLTGALFAAGFGFPTRADAFVHGAGKLHRHGSCFWHPRYISSVGNLSADERFRTRGDMARDAITCDAQALALAAAPVTSGRAASASALTGEVELPARGMNESSNTRAESSFIRQGQRFSQRRDPLIAPLPCSRRRPGARLCISSVNEARGLWSGHGALPHRPCTAARRSPRQQRATRPSLAAADC